MDFTTNFTTGDWIIVAVYLSATVAIGIYANRYITDMADYITGNHSDNSVDFTANLLPNQKHSRIIGMMKHQ